MKKLIIILVVGIVFTFLIYLFYTRNEIAVLVLEKNNQYIKTYPDDCFIKVNNQKFLIRNIYKYKNGQLAEHWFVGSEGFAIQKIGNDENELSLEQKPFKSFDLKNTKESLVFGNKKYKIDEVRNDTIISKIDTSSSILFINEKK